MNLVNNLQRLFFLLIFNTLALVIWAQDQPAGGDGGGSSTTTRSTEVTVSRSEEWYASPWVWAIGAAVFILLLVALLRGGGDRRTDSVRVTKTVDRDV